MKSETTWKCFYFAFVFITNYIFSITIYVFYCENVQKKHKPKPMFISWIIYYESPIFIISCAVLSTYVLCILYTYFLYIL